MHCGFPVCSLQGGWLRNFLPGTLLLRRAVFAWSTSARRVTAAASTVALPFLGTLCESSAADLVWEQQFSPFELAFLQGHRVGKVKLLPGVAGGNAGWKAVAGSPVAQQPSSPAAQ